MAEQKEKKEETVTFEGKLEKVFQTPKVLKFTLGERLFVAFDNKHIQLLKDYIVTDREGTNCKIIIPIPVTKSKDKKTNAEQIVLTNHTRIFLDDQLIFHPIEQEQELQHMEDDIAYAEQLEEEQRVNHQKEKEEIGQNNLIVSENKKLASQKALPKQLSKSLIVKEGGFYNVNGKKIPDAPKIQEEINNLIENSHRIFNLYIVECDKTDEKAWAKVRVEDMQTHQIIEDSVVHHYNTVYDAFLLDLLNSYEKSLKQNKPLPNPIDHIDENTKKPVLTAEANKNIIIRILKFKQFAERDAITKAASRAYLKILNREWRDQDEIDSEQLEVEIVNSTK